MPTITQTAMTYTVVRNGTSTTIATIKKTEDGTITVTPVGITLVLTKIEVNAISAFIDTI